MVIDAIASSHQAIDMTASQTMLNDIARLLNGRPRKTLDWRTPEEAMAEEIANLSNRVALDSRVQAAPINFRLDQERYAPALNC